MTTWQAAYDRKTRPRLDALSAFWPVPVTEAFQAFADYLARTYGLSCAPAIYSKTDGWTFRFGRTGMYLLSNITIEEDAFVVDDIRVSNEASLKAAIAHADSLYAAGFAERLAQESAAKVARQGAANRARVAREKAELEAMQARIVPERFNVYHWSPKVPRRRLQKLYEQDAQGIQDEALADDIGITLYVRCVQGRDEFSLIESGKLKCHNCGAILPYRQGLMECSCGYQYLFRDYMRSMRGNNMPRGSATHIFNAFVDAWPKARDYAGKMRLIDNLIHEFHINLVTGVKGRFVGINLIEGTKKQIADLILGLYGGESTKETRDAFVQNLREQ